MSRIGRKPIVVPDGVTVEIRPGSVSVRGPKGELQERVSLEMTVKQEDGQVTVTRPTDRGDHRALHGLTRTLVANMVFAIEPMITAGGYDVEGGPDGWAVFTRDGSLAAHCEHTVAVTENGPRVLTSREPKGQGEGR